MASLPDASTLRDLARRLKQQARILEAVAKADGDRHALARSRAQLERLGAVEVQPVLDQLDAWLEEERATRRERLARQLRQRCADEGIELVVVTRDPLELRLPPLGLQVDVDADRADLSFGRHRILRVTADADAIIDGVRAALDVLHAEPWDPAAFHRALRTAWARAPGEGYKELADVFPQVVLALQGRRFLDDPRPSNLRPYSKAAFCYDLWRLRRDRAMQVDGWRLSLGTATGGSTRDKKRVFWLEDDRGRGQYFLTLRFVADADDPVEAGADHG